MYLPSDFQNKIRVEWQGLKFSYPNTERLKACDCAEIWFIRERIFFFQIKGNY